MEEEEDLRKRRRRRRDRSRFGLRADRRQLLELRALLYISSYAPLGMDTIVDSRMTNSSLAALRRLDKSAGLNMQNSAQFANTAYSLLALRNELSFGYTSSPSDPVLSRRVYDLTQAV